MQETVITLASAITAGMLYLMWEVSMHKRYDHIVNASQDAQDLITYIREQETTQDVLDVYTLSLTQMRMYEKKIPKDKYNYHLKCLNQAYITKNREIMGYVFGKPLNQN